MKWSIVAGYLFLLGAFAPLALASDDPTLDMLWDMASQPASQGPTLFQGIGDLIGQRAIILGKPDELEEELRACGKCARRAEIQQQIREAEFAKSLLEMAESAYFGNKLFPNPSSRGLDPFDAWKIGIKIRPDYLSAALPACVKLYDMAMDCAVAEDNRYAIDAKGSRCEPYLRLSIFCAQDKGKEFNDYLRQVRRMESGELVYERVGNDVLPQFVYHNVPAGTALPLRGGPTQNLRNFSITVANDVRGNVPGEIASVAVRPGFAPAGPANLLYGGIDDFAEPWRGQYWAMLGDLVKEPGGGVITCRYNADQHHVHEYVFWYERAPAVIANPQAAAEFKKALPLNPLMRIGPAISQCPPSNVLAAKQIRLTPAGELQRLYEGKLSDSALRERISNPATLLQ